MIPLNDEKKRNRMVRSADRIRIPADIQETHQNIRFPVLNTPCFST